MWWWRRVRNHTYWDPGANQHPDGLPYYVHDVALRRQHNEEGLSCFSVADDSEADRVTHYCALTLYGYDNLDYLLIPDDTWDGFGLRPIHVPMPNIHPYLSTRHYEVRGLTEGAEPQIWRHLRGLCQSILQPP